MKSTPVEPSPPQFAADREAVPEELRWFQTEVHAHDAQLRAYLRGAFPAVRDVDDLVQESYLRVWRARAAHPIRSAKAFLFTVARHLAFRTVGKDRWAEPSALEEDGVELTDEAPNPAQVLNRQEKVILLATALRKLPPRCRQVVVMRKLQGMSQREVAEQLGLSQRTVENQLARGIRRCEAFLRQRGVQKAFDA